MNLKSAPDHPASLLSGVAILAQTDVPVMRPDLGAEGLQDLANICFGIETAAEFLRGYEKEKGITFAALDNEALAELTEAVDDFRSGSSADGTTDGGNWLVSAITALLGVE